VRIYQDSWENGYGSGSSSITGGRALGGEVCGVEDGERCPVWF